MAKFSLKMPDGMDVRNLEELKNHFDLDSVLGYYYDGRLLKWLESRDYEGNTVSAVRELDKDSADVKKHLAQIFGIEIKLEDEESDITKFGDKIASINKLKQWTDNEEILKSVDHVAFDQEELEDLLDEDVTPVYLCGVSFTIPLGKENVTYIGVNNPMVNISAKEPLDFAAKGIVFEEVTFCDSYQNLLPKEIPAQLKRSRENVKVIRAKDPVFEYYGKYYFHDGNKTIYRINKDGSYKERIYQLNEEYGEIQANIQVDDSGIYFVDRRQLYRVSLDGTNKKEYNGTDGCEFIVNNDWIYCIENNGSVFFRNYALKILSVDGKSNDTIIDNAKDINNLHLIGNDVYYVCDGKLFKLLDGTKSPQFIFDIYINDYNGLSFENDNIYLIKNNMSSLMEDNLIEKIDTIDLDGMNYKKISVNTTVKDTNDNDDIDNDNDDIDNDNIIKSLHDIKNTFTNIFGYNINDNILIYNGYSFFLNNTKILKKKIGSDDKIKQIIDIGGSYSATGFCIVDDSIFIQKLNSNSSNVLYQYDLNGQKPRSLY